MVCPSAINAILPSGIRASTDSLLEADMASCVNRTGFAPGTIMSWLNALRLLQAMVNTAAIFLEWQMIRCIMVMMGVLFEIVQLQLPAQSFIFFLISFRRK